MGVSRLDPQHPYLVLWERPGWGGSTAYSLLSHLEHRTLPEGELHWAATGLVPRAPQLCKEVRGVNSETLSRSCMFCQKNRRPIISPRTSEEALAADAASTSPAYLGQLGHPKGQVRGHPMRTVPADNSPSGLGTNTLFECQQKGHPTYQGQPRRAVGQSAKLIEPLPCDHRHVWLTKSPEIPELGC